MWQLFALGSVVTAAGHNIVDKVALVTDKKIDFTAATFWRFFIFTVLVGVVGLLGWAGPVEIVFTPLLALLALVSLTNGLFYTYLLEHVEVTSIGALYYFPPFLFLAIDTVVLQTSLSPSEIAGIILLVLGGLGFALDGKTHRMKKEFSKLVWAMFAFNVLFMGLQAYLFKYMNTEYGTSSASFLVSYGVLAVFGLLCIQIARGKFRALWTHPARIYIPRIAISKGFDAVSAILWTQALTLAAVSQVTAMNALAPLVLFIGTVFAQKVLRMRVEERLGRVRMEWKAAAVCFLVAGGMLVG